MKAERCHVKNVTLRTNFKSVEEPPINLSEAVSIPARAIGESIDTTANTRKKLPDCSNGKLVATK